MSLYLLFSLKPRAKTKQPASLLQLLPVKPQSLSGFSVKAGPLAGRLPFYLPPRKRERLNSKVCSLPGAAKLTILPAPFSDHQCSFCTPAAGWDGARGRFRLYVSDYHFSVLACMQCEIGVLCFPHRQVWQNLGDDGGGLRFLQVFSFFYIFYDLISLGMLSQKSRPWEIFM